MREPYAKPFGRGGTFHGLQTMPAERFTMAVSELNRRGWRVATHAVGDAAIEQVLTGYEAADAEGSIGDRRWTIEHGFIVAADQLARIRELGLVVSAQHHLYVAGPSRERYWGRARAERVTSVRTYLDHGIAVSLGSDSPVVPFSPLQVLYRATRSRWRMPAWTRRRRPASPRRCSAVGTGREGFRPARGGPGPRRPLLRPPLCRRRREAGSTAPRRSRGPPGRPGPSVLLLDDNVPKIPLGRGLFQDGAYPPQQAHAPFRIGTAYQDLYPEHADFSPDPVNEDGRPRRGADRDREARHPSVDRHRQRAHGVREPRDPADPRDCGYRHRDCHLDRRHPAPAWKTTSKSPAAAAIRPSIRRALRSDDQQPAPITDLQAAVNDAIAALDRT